jgi:SAM-dependent methyltransferase
MVARYDAVAEMYGELMGDDATDETAQTLIEMLGDVGGLRVLDVACGTGRVSRELARDGASVTGLDISRRMLDLGIELEESNPLGIRYLHGNVSDGDVLPGETFDAVSCNFGMSDTDDLDGALDTIARVLVPRGAFVFSILHPCFPGWDDDAPSAWPPDGGYHSEGWWKADNSGWRGSTGSNFRMLSTYVNRLVACGFTIDHLTEPEAPAALREKLPDQATTPYTLVVRCLRR